MWGLVLFGVLISGGFTQAQYYNPVPPYDQGGLPKDIRIGGLFDEWDTLDETALKHAVERVNQDHTVLPRSTLSTQIQTLQPGDSHQASEKVCEMMGTGIAAIFGPQSAQAASHVQSICDAFELPHIETKWDYNIRKENYLINLSPHPTTLAKAYFDLVEAFNWTRYAILYENGDSLIRLQDLIKSPTFSPLERNAVIRKIPVDGNYRGVLRELLKWPEPNEIRNILIDCSTETLTELLKQAQQVGLMNYEFSYIITSLDLQTMDLEPYKYGEINITAFRMLDPEKPEVQAVVQQWNTLAMSNSNSNEGRNQGYGQSNYFGSQNQFRSDRRKSLNSLEPENFQMMKTETALIYDAVYLFGKALHVLDSSQRIDIRPLNCDSSDTWQHGYSIINYMKMVQLQGLTGLIQFDTFGYRSDVQLDVVQLTSQGLGKIGVWDTKFVTKFNWLKREEDPIIEDDTIPLPNRTIIISTILNDPFCMYKRSKDAIHGNDQYEGYTIDLAAELSKILKFKYEIRIVADSKYGNMVKSTGQWDGMVREVMDGVADIAIADLAVTEARVAVVDFSLPFMNLGISILFTKPQPKAPSLYSFLSPFSSDVWIYMCFAFFGVSLIMFIVARISPYEWDCPHPCIEDPDELENQFTLNNSFWFTVGSLMQQGSDVAPKITPYEWVVSNQCSNKKVNEIVFINDLSFSNTLWYVMAGLFRQNPDIFPKATSTRMIGGIWWFFTLIMVSSYTANLASFLIVQDLEDTIKSVADFPKFPKVKYGCVGGGATSIFFKNNYNLLYNNMEKQKTFVLSNSEGISKVANNPGRYAFFVENTILQYNAERHCNFTQVGGLLDNKGYGIAMRKNSKYRQDFSSAVLKLQEGGVLDTLKRKWWTEERKGEQCETTSSDVKPLALQNVGGVFVVLVGGCVIAGILSFVEFYYKTTTTAKSAGDNVKEALSQELKFALAFSGDSKPVIKKKESLSSETPNDNVMGSNPYLDLGMDSSYGFPRPVNRSNGGIPPDGFT